MQYLQFLQKRSPLASLVLTFCLAGLMAPLRSTAEAIWHCSRTSVVEVSQTDVQAQEEFRLSSFDAVSVTLQDLLDVYTGRDVKLGPYSLKACFMHGDDPLSTDALLSLGLKSHVMQKMAAKNAIVQSHLQVVTDEQQMLQCMERNFPVFGYLSKETVTEKVVPCF